MSAGYSQCWGGPPPRKYAVRLLDFPAEEREALIQAQVPEHLQALVRSHLEAWVARHYPLSRAADNARASDPGNAGG